MADITPNYSLERQRLELEIAQFKLNVQSQNFRIAQMGDERERVEANIEATKKTIGELTTTLAGLTEKKSQ